MTDGHLETASNFHHLDGRDPLARQMGRQRLATARTRRARLGGRPISGGLGGRLTSLVLGFGFLEVTDQQLELKGPLRGAAEAGPLHQRERRAQLLDVQRLGVEPPSSRAMPGRVT